jgi:hypothetical protein
MAELGFLSTLLAPKDLSIFLYPNGLPIVRMVNSSDLTGKTNAPNQKNRRKQNQRSI